MKRIARQEDIKDASEEKKKRSVILNKSVDVRWFVCEYIAFLCTATVH